MAASPAKKGGLYEGTVSGGAGKNLFVQVSRDGTSVADFGIAAKPVCSDGKGHTFGVLAAGEGKLPRITNSGAVTYTSKGGRFKVAGHTGKATTSFSGSFSADGKTFTGTVGSSFVARGFNCPATPAAFSFTLKKVKHPIASSGPYSVRGKGLTRGLSKIFATSLYADPTSWH